MDATSLSFDWFILVLRILFILLIYLFLYQVARVSVRELIAVGSIATDSRATNLPSPNASLEVRDPAESSLEVGDRLPLEHYTTIGRNDDNVMVIDDGFVSGQHSEMIFDQGRWWLMDLGSTNGTFINSLPVRSRIEVQTDDIVQFGRTSFAARL